MRTIKFRGKRVNNGEWAYGSLIKVKHESYIACFIIPLEDAWDFFDVEQNDRAIYGAIEVIPETVGQFIGQMDSKRTEEYPKGLEICQGDMVEASIYCDEEPQVLEVIFRKGAFVIDYEDSESDCVIVGEFAGSLKIIGNKSDNPELL